MEPTVNLNFGQALYWMKEGKAVTRAGWNGAKSGLKMTTHAQFPDSGSANTNPYLFIVVDHVVKDESPESGTVSRTPWFPSNLDLFATDWAVVG